MSGRFAVPLSSSPPSTPDSRRSFANNGSKANSFFSHPSTTPAGPPPSSTNSFTPAGHPPPSSIFGSSQLKSGNRLFGSKTNSSNVLAGKGTNQTRYPEVEKPKQRTENPTVNTSSLGTSPLRSAQRGRTFAVPDPSSPTDLAAINDDEEDFENSMEEESEEMNGDNSELLTDSHAQFGSLIDDGGLSRITPRHPNANGSLAGLDGIDWGKPHFGSSVDVGTPRSAKRLRGSVAFQDVSVQERPPAKRQKKESAIPDIIRKLSVNLGTAKLHESDHLILQTESWFEKIYQAESLPEDRENAVEKTIPLATSGLCNLWRTTGQQTAQDVDMEDDVVMSIGPDQNAAPLQKASFVASLLLQLRHPPPIHGKQAYASSRSLRTALSIDSSQPPARPTPLPRVLHDWLEQYHNPYESAIVDLQIHQPNSTSHINYWDILFNMLLRGKVFDAVQILRKSNFQYARTAREENGSDGYQGAVLKNIGTVVSRMARIFEECPTLREDDWNIAGNDWSLFRRRVQQALADLVIFVEGSKEEQERAVPELEAPSFGLRSGTSTLGRSLREAERKIPSIIYENFKTMYGILLGRAPEIVSSAQDWVEATIGLTMWWDGEDDDDDNLGTSFVQSRRSFRQSQNRGSRTVDLNPTAAYVRRLAAAFERVTDDDDPDLFQINSNNSVEVGLASVFEGNVEGVIGLLHSWSLPVSSAVAEIASLSGWFESSIRPGKMAGFNQSDLMVLSYGQREQELTSDSILIDYADALFGKESLKNHASGKQIEGWELSMQILSRLDDEELGIKKLGELLQQLPLTSDQRVDKLLRLCQGFGLDREASDIAEV